MLEVGDLITLNNDKKYIVTKQVYLKGHHYIFLISEDCISDFLICDFIKDELEVVKDEELIKKLIALFNN